MTPLEQLNARITARREQAATTRADLTADQNAIKANAALNSAAKQAAIDMSRANAATILTALRTQETDDVAATRDYLEAALFGTSTSTPRPTFDELMAYRDAQDRAARLTDTTTAQTQLASAVRSCDTTLAAAILQRARAANWPAVITRYRARYPHHTPHLDALDAVDQHDATAAAAAYALPPP